MLRSNLLLEVKKPLQSGFFIALKNAQRFFKRPI